MFGRGGRQQTTHTHITEKMKKRYEPMEKYTQERSRKNEEFSIFNVIRILFVMFLCSNGKNWNLEIYLSRLDTNFPGAW